MDYINRLDNYDGAELARLAQDDEYKLYDEALCIYKKFGESVEAIKVILHKLKKCGPNLVRLSSIKTCLERVLIASLRLRTHKCILE